MLAAITPSSYQFIASRAHPFPTFPFKKHLRVTHYFGLPEKLSKLALQKYGGGISVVAR